MTTRMSARFLAILVMLAPIWASADTSTEVRNAEKLYLDAWTGRNDVALDRILSERFIYIGADGEQHDKVWNLNMLRSGRLLYDGYDVVPGPVFDLGETVVSMGHLHAPGTWDGRAFTDDISYTMVWVREDGALKLLVEQNSRLDVQQSD